MSVNEQPGDEMERGAGRRANRASMFLLALVTPEKGQPVKVRIRNLSATGAMADCEHPIAQGTAITIDLRGIGEVAGRIAWSDANKVGIAFATEIDPKLTLKTSAAKPDERVPSYLKTFAQGSALRR